MDTSHFSTCFFPMLLAILMASIFAKFYIYYSNKLTNNVNSKERKSSSTSDIILFLVIAVFIAAPALVSLAISVLNRRSLTPFPAKRVTIRQREDSQQQQLFQHEGHALITGASQGIGRAIAIELAKRYAPHKCFILTSRASDSLYSLAEHMSSQYNANVTVVPNIDLSKPEGAHQLYRTTKEKGLYVDVLILNAGVGSKGSHVTLDVDTMRHMIHLNIQSTTILSSLYGHDMKQRLKSSFHAATSTRNDNNKDNIIIGARIMILSSLAGVVPGAPFASMYGASKAYVRSLSWGLASELQTIGIGVTCVLPGATASTNFAHSSSMEEAVVWHYPWTVSTGDAVARGAVDGMVRGDVEVYPGRFLDLVFVKVVIPLVPPWLVTWFFGVSWSPWPYRFPPGWRKDSTWSPKIVEGILINQEL